MTLKSLKLLCLLLTLIIVSNNDVIANEDNLSLFKSANELYQKSNYKEALVKYEELLEKGYVSDDLFSNIGNAYLKENRTGLSILNFEKALLLNSNNAQSYQNLKLAKESVINPVTQIPDFFVISFWKKFVGSQNISFWLSMHVLFLFVAMSFALFHWTNLIPRIKSKLNNSRITMSFILASVSLSVIFFIASLQRQSQLTGVNYGIIMSEESTLLDGPDSRSNEIASLSEGLKVKILDEIDEWYKIQLEDKDNGWIEKEIIELIKI